ncbi:asparagine synthetase B family protein [Alloalcanivorax venustensis]|uniref:hypothetical protein n=1 Tax=Alloalcanivorax venustensis TaxID=172371 RepID=UPI00189114D5|nr:hypothetical protein [Alloalcanivorax venustensis]
MEEIDVPGGSILLDGWVKEPVSSIDPRSSDPVTGVYNYIFLDDKVDTITIKNDSLGQRPLYFTVGPGRVVVGTVFWDVAKKAKKSSADICYESIRQLRLYRRLTPPSRTLLEGVFLLPAGSKLEIFDRGANYKLTQSLTMKQDPDHGIDEVVAAHQLDKAIHKTFEYIKGVCGPSDVWFGNSGGLDSRLIPAYAERVGLPVKGYIVSEARPRGFLSQSELSSDLVSKHFNLENKKINFDEGDPWGRLIRDIHVNPFGPANFHKNAGFEGFHGDIILTGGNSFVIANDNNAWRDLAEIDGDPVENYARKIFFRGFSSECDDKDYISNLKECIQVAIPNGDNFSSFRTLHQLYLNKTSPAGAFESMSMAGEFQYIYHPFITEESKRWPEHIFYDRKVQSALFEGFFPELLSFPDQSGKVWRNDGQKLGRFARVKSKIRLKVRTDGLNYPRWLASSWYRGLMKLVECEVSRSQSGLPSELLREASIHKRAQDSVDLVKLAIMVRYLEAGDFSLGGNRDAG